MALGRNAAPPHIRQQAASLSSTDEGLRAWMLRIYGYMTAGLAITGAVALAANTMALKETASGLELTSFGQALYASPISWVVMLSPLGIVLAMSFGGSRMRASTMQVLFWALAACYGLSISAMLLVYTGESVVRVFFIASSMFLAMSIYGYTTKRALSGFGPILMMGVIGLIVAGVVNIFLASSALQFAISVIGVLVFAGLTAYDTQRLKETYVAGQVGETATKQAVSGALALYLDFILIFIYLLMLLGNRR